MASSNMNTANTANLSVPLRARDREDSIGSRYARDLFKTHLKLSEQY